MPEMSSSLSKAYNEGVSRKQNVFDLASPFLKAISISVRMPGVYPNYITKSNLPLNGSFTSCLCWP